MAAGSRGVWLAAILCALTSACAPRPSDEQAAASELARALASRPAAAPDTPRAENGATLDLLWPRGPAGSGESPRATGLALGGGDLFLTDGTDIWALRDGGLTPAVALLPKRPAPESAALAAERGGGFVVAYPALGEVRRVDATSGQSAVIAAGLDWPSSPVILPDGAVVVAETGAGRVTRLDASGARSSVANGLLSPVGVARSGGRILVVEAAGGRLLAVREGAYPVVVAAGLSRPVGVAVDRLGRAFVAEAGLKSVVRVDRDGSRLVVASSLSLGGDDAAHPLAVPLVIDRDDRLVLLLPGSGEVLRLTAP